MTDRIVFRNSTLYYNKEGTGPKTMLLFHGFGQDHWAFEPWVERWKDEYTFYVFDLFFHGESQWKNPHAITKEDWRNVLTLFFSQENVTSFSLGGFSMGTRFAFVALELFPDRVQQLIAVAPDGIARNFWYDLATRSSLMRSFFRGIVASPGRLRMITRLLRFLHLQNRNLLRFVDVQMNTGEKRQRVYNSWVYFRYLALDPRDLRAIVNKQNIATTFVLGKSDNVIPTEEITAFAKTLNNCHLQVIETSHYDLIAKGVDYLN